MSQKTCEQCPLLKGSRGTADGWAQAYNEAMQDFFACNERWRSRFAVWKLAVLLMTAVATAGWTAALVLAYRFGGLLQ